MNPLEHEGRLSQQALQARKKRAKAEIILNFNTGYVECYGCGQWFDFNKKILPTRVDFAAGVMKAFSACHRSCRKPNDRGKQLKEAARVLHSKVDEWKSKGLSQLELTREIGAWMATQEVYWHGE